MPMTPTSTEEHEQGGVDKAQPIESDQVQPSPQIEDKKYPNQPEPSIPSIPGSAGPPPPHTEPTGSAPTSLSPKHSTPAVPQSTRSSTHLPPPHHTGSWLSKVLPRALPPAINGAKPSSPGPKGVHFKDNETVDEQPVNGDYAEFLKEAKRRDREGQQRATSSKYVRYSDSFSDRDSLSSDDSRADSGYFELSSINSDDSSPERDSFLRNSSPFPHSSDGALVTRIIQLPAASMIAENGKGFGKVMKQQGKAFARQNNETLRRNPNALGAHNIHEHLAKMDPAEVENGFNFSLKHDGHAYENRHGEVYIDGRKTKISAPVGKDLDLETIGKMTKVNGHLVDDSIFE